MQQCIRKLRIAGLVRILTVNMLIVTVLLYYFAVTALAEVRDACRPFMIQYRRNADALK